MTSAVWQVKHLQLNLYKNYRNMLLILALKYNDDIKKAEIVSVVESVKFQCSVIVEDAVSIKYWSAINVIHRSEKFALHACPEILFLAIPVTVNATCERSFSKPKPQIKNYLNMSQDRLSGLALISIEHDTASRIDYDDVMDTFACAKARIVVFHRVHLCLYKFRSKRLRGH